MITKTEENVHKFVIRLRTHCASNIRIIAEDSNMDKDTPRQILIFINVKKLCEERVPKLE
jgi:hypothetical protein